jgi:hypothetical protein
MTDSTIERIGYKAHGHEQARAYDLEQHAKMTPDERRRVAKALRDRYWGTNCPDVRSVFAGRRSKRR